MKEETLRDIHQYYFIGIGGVGMSSLAEYFRQAGKNVAGYDRVGSPNTKVLEKRGVSIHYDEDVALIPQEMTVPENKGQTLVVFTPAVPRTHKELEFFRDNGYRVIKRAELLGLISAEHPTVAIAGTHGKTTITAMIAHIFQTAGLDFVAFLGGISSNYDTNMIISDKGSLVLAEADEYDRSFLKLHPQIVVVSSLDADHLDIYGSKEELEKSYNEFLAQIQSDGYAIVNSKALKNLHIPASCQAANYSLSEKANFYGANIRIESGRYFFDINTPEGIIEGVSSGLPGRHNVENAIAAAAVALHMGVEANIIKTALDSFKGVKRRFEYQYQSENVIYIDDYAHHPVELEACIVSARELFPGKKLTGIFQPHLYSRTRDLCDGFASSLSLLDQVILLDIYPAREQPIPGVDAALIFDKITVKNKQLLSKENLIENLSIGEGEVLMTLGAGDIDTMVIPIREKLMARDREGG